MGLEPVNSRLTTHCPLSHPAPTAMVTLESVLGLAVVGLRFSLLLCQLFGPVTFLELVVDEQEQALGSVKKHRNVSAFHPYPLPK